jgi:2-(1,2-epoxy-1,2-dihydrophenyl)acetyl-CoA isomerase
MADRGASVSDHSSKGGSDSLIVSRAGGVTSIVLNRPHRKNALTSDMVSGITETVVTASDDDDTRVVVITANGDDFCSGIDLVESNRPGRGTGDGHGRPRTGHLQRSLHTGAHRMIQAIFSAQVPVVAGVQGWAAGVGNALALSADVTVAADTARFWVPFVTKGFTPDTGNSWLLPRLVGLARAKEMVLRGKPVPGPRAEAWGLVSCCVPAGDLQATVDATVAEFASMPTVSVGLAKTLLHGNLDSPFAVALQNEAIYEELAVRSDDFKEGIRAFMDKRDPDFTGW